MENESPANCGPDTLRSNQDEELTNFKEKLKNPVMGIKKLESRFNSTINGDSTQNVNRRNSI